MKTAIIGKINDPSVLAHIIEMSGFDISEVHIINEDTLLAETAFCWADLQDIDTKFHRRNSRENGKSADFYMRLELVHAVDAVIYIGSDMPDIVQDMLDRKKKVYIGVR